MAELQRQLASLRNQQDRLLNLRLLEELDEKTFGAKNPELRDSISQLNLQIENCDCGRAERGEIAEKVFVLSQSLRQKWVRRITA